MLPFFFLFFLNLLLIAIAISKQHKNMASSRKSMIRQIKTAITSIILSIIFMFSTMPTAGWSPENFLFAFEILFNLETFPHISSDSRRNISCFVGIKHWTAHNRLLKFVAVYILRKRFPHSLFNQQSIQEADQHCIGTGDF